MAIKKGIINDVEQNQLLPLTIAEQVLYDTNSGQTVKEAIENISISGAILYSTTGENVDGAMTQKATTEKLNEKTEFDETYNYDNKIVASGITYEDISEFDKVIGKVGVQRINGLMGDVQIPTLPNPFQLIIRQNGERLGTYDGSETVELSLLNEGVPTAETPVAGQITSGQTDLVKEYWISSDGKTWYRIWLSGWKECGGLVYNGGIGSGAKTVMFPLNFSNTNYMFIQQNIHTNSTGAGQFGGENYVARQVNQTIFNMPTNGWGGYSWYACGY